MQTLYSVRYVHPKTLEEKIVLSTFNKEVVKRDLPSIEKCYGKRNVKVIEKHSR